MEALFKNLSIHYFYLKPFPDIAGHVNAIQIINSQMLYKCMFYKHMLHNFVTLKKAQY